MDFREIILSPIWVRVGEDGTSSSFWNSEFLGEIASLPPIASLTEDPFKTTFDIYYELGEGFTLEDLQNGLQAIADSDFGVDAANAFISAFVDNVYELEDGGEVTVTAAPPPPAPKNYEKHIKVALYIGGLFGTVLLVNGIRKNLDRRR